MVFMPCSGMSCCVSTTVSSLARYYGRSDMLPSPRSTRTTGFTLERKGVSGLYDLTEPLNFCNSSPPAALFPPICIIFEPCISMHIHFYLLNRCSNCDLDKSDTSNPFRLELAPKAQASHIEWTVVADLSSVW